MSENIIIATGRGFAKAQIITESGPAITGTIAAGETVTITDGSYLSARARTGTNRELFLNDVDVTANMSGDNYTIPSDAQDGYDLRVEVTPIFGTGERQIEKTETAAVTVGEAPASSTSSTVTGQRVAEMEA